MIDPKLIEAIEASSPSVRNDTGLTPQQVAARLRGGVQISYGGLEMGALACRQAVA